MLRASAIHTNRSFSLEAIVDPAIDPHLTWGRELLAFTDGAVGRDQETMASARAALAAAGGRDAVVRAAACVGNFQMMNRLLDALGVRVDRKGVALAQKLGIDVPEHLLPGRLDQRSRPTPGTNRPTCDA